jgi:hypothetical protein
MLFTACDDDDDGVAPIDEDVAFVSFYQASPDAPDLRVVVDSRQINSLPFSFGEYTGYLRFFADERNLQFGPFDASNIVASTTETFEDDEFYSVFLTGEYPDIEPLVLQEDSESPEEGNAKIRFLHLSPDAPTVSLFNEDGAIFESIEFREPTNFTSVESGSYDLTVQTADGGQEVLNIPDAFFQEGGFYTIVVRGYNTPPTGNDNDLSAEILVN